MILVTGFGPFPGVLANPSADLVRNVHGYRVAGQTLVAEVLPVSFERAPNIVATMAAQLSPTLLLGFGVATEREGVWVEKSARANCGDRADVDGQTVVRLPGPELVSTTLDATWLGDCLGARQSDDCGSYVCNAWLHQLAQRVDVPVGFVHIGPGELTRNWLLAGLIRFMDGQGAHPG